MKRSILRRAASTVAVSALAFTGVAFAGAAPAHAASCTTTTVASVSDRLQSYGDYNTVRIDVAPTCNDGDTYIEAGTTYVQKSINGGASWVNVHSESTFSASLVYYSGTGIATQNTLYRGYYVGGAGNNNTYTTSVSAPVAINVTRNFKVSDKDVRGGVRGIFKIKPKASIKGLKVKFQVKRGGWKKYKTVRANRKGIASAVFKASRKGIKYRMILPGKRGFTKSVEGPFVARTSYYRAVIR